jgi:hypothetical protein
MPEVKKNDITFTIMSDYSKGKIYKITATNPEGETLVYIGSTTQPLKERERLHYKEYKRWLNGKSYKCGSFKLLELGNCSFELIEDFPCLDKQELLKQEGTWQREYMFKENIIVTNIVLVGRSRQEWCQDNKDKIIKYHQKYHQNNKDRIIKLKQQWNQEHRKERLEWQREYDENRKEKRQEKVTCECGTIVTQACIVRHRKTEKHKSNLDKLCVA